MSAVDDRRVRPTRDVTNGLLAVWGVLVFVFLFLPILVIVDLLVQQRPGCSWSGTGSASRPYTDALNNPTIRSAIITSIRAAAGAAVIATILARSPGSRSRAARASGRRLPRCSCSSCW